MSNSERLSSQIQRRATTRKRPDSSSYQSLSWQDESALAESFACSLLDVEKAALGLDIVPERYARNQQSLSCQDQLRLLKSCVAIIGQGGLGGTVTDLLCRLGVGSLTLVDGDVFDESNLNRQLLSRMEHLGQAKSLCGAAHVQAINPAIEVQAYSVFFTKDNGTSLLKGCDLVIDCLDTIPARLELQEACRHLSIPMVSAAVGGTSGQATVIFPGDPGLTTLYGDADTGNGTPARGIEARFGTLGFSAATMAALEVSAAMSVLLGKATLRHRLLLVELGEFSTELVQLPST